MNKGVIRICFILFMVLLISFCSSVICFAEGEDSIVSVSESETDYISISNIQNLSQSDFLIFICFILSILCGLFICQAFSFWKW